MKSSPRTELLISPLFEMRDAERPRHVSEKPAVRREFPGCRIEIESHDVIGKFVGGGEEFFSGQEIDVARTAAAGKHHVAKSKFSRFVDFEDRDRIVSPVGGEEKSAVGGEADRRSLGRDVAGETRQRGSTADLNEFRSVILERGDRIAQFVEEIGIFSRGIEDQMPRPGAGRFNFTVDRVSGVDTAFRVERVEPNRVDTEVDDAEKPTVRREFREMRMSHLLAFDIDAAPDVGNDPDAFRNGAAFKFEFREIAAAVIGRVEVVSFR